MLPKTYSAALVIGAKHYFTGKPCKHGHVAKRHVRDRTCFKCTSVRGQKWVKSNTEKQRVRVGKWRSANPARATKIQREWRDKNREKTCEYGRQSRKRNWPAHRAAIYRWRRNNPELSSAYARSHAHMKRANKRVVVSEFSARDIAPLLRSQRFQCVYCCSDISKKYHLDHRVPFSRGGTNTKENVQALCPTCNLRKGAKPPEVFAAIMESERRIA